MKFEETIESLKNQGLIAQGSGTAVCTDSVQSARFWFGAVGAAVAMSNARRYILAVSENEIKLFDIKKDVNTYMNTFSEIKKGNIIKAAIGGWGSKMLNIKTANAGVLKFQIPGKIQGYKQSDAVQNIVKLIKTYYSKEKLTKK